MLLEFDLLGSTHFLCQLAQKQMFSVTETIHLPQKQFLQTSYTPMPISFPTIETAVTLQKAAWNTSPEKIFQIIAG